MKLFYQTHSPYARKVLVMAHEAGLTDRLDVIHHETSPTVRNDTVFEQNPLGKVPVLILGNGFAMFDSTVICDYLDSLHDRERFIPPHGPARLVSLRWQALAQGMCDAGVAARYEAVRRPEALRYPAFRDGQLYKLIGAYDFLEHEAGIESRDAEAEHVDLGQIALATALDWLAFRQLPDFERGRPRLSAWYRAFLQRPSMRSTAFVGETVD